MPEVVCLDFTDVINAAHESIEETDDADGVFNGFCALSLGAGGEGVPIDQVWDAHS